MGYVTLNSVFLSYSSKDNVFVKRVYDDLKRSGFDVWGFEENGRVGVNFMQEFSNELRNRRFFCLMDSPNARLAKYVKKECEIAMERITKDDSFILVPCLIHSKEPSHSWWFVEIFANQNLISYINLTDYERGIRKLCRHLGAVYYPASQIPRDKDFLEELFSSSLKRNDITELSELYAHFRKEYSKRPSIAKNWANNLIARLDDLGATKIVSPRIALGVMEAEAERHMKAGEIFHRFAQLQPDDPRAWAGLAGARFFLADYTGALESYYRCKEIIVGTTNSEHILHLPEVSHNIARTLLALGQAQKAWEELESLSAKDKCEIHVQSLKGKILLYLENPGKAVKYLKKALEGFDRNCQTPPGVLVIDLAECYKLLDRSLEEEETIQLGISMFKDDPEMFRWIAGRSLNNFEPCKAINFLKKAILLEKDSVIYKAELSSLFYFIGKKDEAFLEAKLCIELEERMMVKTPRDQYYLGLAYYILSKNEVAENLLQKARIKDNIIAGWPSYKKVVCVAE